jgi:hypothetical protein
MTAAVGAEGLLLDRQRALEELFSLGVRASRIVDGRAQPLLPAFHCPHWPPAVSKGSARTLLATPAGLTR